MDDKRLFLLDAYALIFRAYYALIRSPQFSRDGFNTSAVFGFVNTLEDLFRKEKPTHMAVCFDPPGPTFRHELMESYKGERETTPEDIRLSVPIIKEIIKAYRIPIVECAGFEADDVIGTLAAKSAGKGYTVYMMTPDKDFGQLVGPHIYQYKPPYKGNEFEVRGEKEICERYGLENARQIIDLLALMGDTADNIPGCPGIGEKTAVKLLTEYHSAENVIANIPNLKGALKRKVEEGTEQITLSKTLATIRTDVPVSLDDEDILVKEPDTEKLFSIFKSLDFTRLSERVRKRLSGDTPAKEKITAVPSLFDSTESEEKKTIVEKTDLPTGKFMIAEDDSALEDFRKHMSIASECGLWLHTSGDSDYSCTWHGTAVTFPDGSSFYIPAYFRNGQKTLLNLMADAKMRKVTCAAKRDYVCAYLAGSEDKPLVNYFDITLAHYLLQPEFRHNIEELADRYLGIMLERMPDDRQSLPLLTKDTADNACARSFCSLRLHDILLKEVTEGGMKSLLEEIELPLAAVLAEMETAGVRIDVSALNAAAERMSGQLEELEQKIHRLTGVEFNVSSPAQTGEVLFGKLQLDPKAKKTKSGQYSTSEAVLEKLVTRHPAVSLILEYRSLKKLLGTYLTALPECMDPRTKKIHTTYNQTTTATGRLSSTSPNLQNIPVREGEGREIRRAFIPDEGCKFLSADYSQIELRLVADLAHDETMIDAFRNGHDIHAITAAKIYGVDPSEVTADQRRNAKTANFGILYGISAFGLSSRLNIPRHEAKMLIDGYHATFPAVSRYMEKTLDGARRNGYVSTISGRKRMQPDINSSNAVVRGYAERNAINAPIQGSAADVIKKAMISIQREIKEKGLASKMIMQVHDELNFNVPESEIEIMRELVTRNMENAYSGNVLLTASCGVADNWLAAH